MADADAIVEIERRNAIRASAMLPPLDMEIELRRARWLNEFKNYESVSDTHAAERERIKAEVIADYRARIGEPDTMNSSIYIFHHTRRRFAAFMAETTGMKDPLLGPRPDEIRYGSDRLDGPKQGDAEAR